MIVCISLPLAMLRSEAQPNLSQYADFPAVQIAQRLDEILCARAPSAQLGYDRQSVWPALSAHGQVVHGGGKRADSTGQAAHQLGSPSEIDAPTARLQAQGMNGPFQKPLL